MENLNRLVIEHILNKIPSHMKLVDFLMDFLSLGRESAYRRIREDVPFTFNEIIKLSNEFDFSIDKLICKNKGKSMFIDLSKNTLDDLEGMFIDMLKFYVDIVENMQKTTLTKGILAITHMNFNLLFSTDYLFKFMYYKWMHQFYGIPPNLSFAKFEMPAEILCYKTKFLTTFRSLGNVNLIFLFDQYVFLNAIKQISYYYKRELVTEDELEYIVEEFRQVINYIRKLAENGTNEGGSRFDFYLSMLNINSSSCYVDYGEKEEAIVSLNNVVLFHLTCSDICSVVQKWLNSLKKNSTLITQSNEFIQAKFFDKQLLHLSRIRNMSFFNFIDE